MKILVAPNAFKEAINSIEVAKYIASGLKKASDDFQIIESPVADGGVGTLLVLARAVKGNLHEISVSGPMGGRVNARFGVVEDPESGEKTGIIEMAEVAGLNRVPQKLRNPFKATTKGVGELVLAAVAKNCTKLIIGIGDSATIDCGIGFLSVLGVDFLNQSNRPVAENGNGVLSLVKIDATGLMRKLREVKIVVAADVSNKLTGPNGALMFAQQKGVAARMLPKADRIFRNFRQIILNQHGLDLNKVPGAGAAGGIGAGMAAILGAEMKSGFELVRDITGLEAKIKESDLVITGEGQIDKQSLYGKSLIRMIKLCNKNKKPVICVAGSILPEAKLLYRYGVIGLYGIANKPMDLREALTNTPILLQDMAYSIGKTIWGIGFK